MVEVLFTPAYLPFAAAFCAMAMVGLIEALGLGLGGFEIDAELDADVGAPSLLDWIGLRRGIPVLVWLMSFLGCFTLAGLVIQQSCTALTGAPLPWGLASIAALGIGGSLNRFAAALLAHFFPAFETSVISSDDLLMRRGIILEGVSRRGHPARARVIDQHKQAHYVMVEPHYENDRIETGGTVLLISKEGAIFLGLPDENTSLSSLS
jgi:Protein of unknown function (DUF1449)